MRSFNYYFRIPMANSRVSDAKLYKFIVDHISRLRTNNPGGKYDAMITSLEEKKNHLFTHVLEEDRSRAVRGGSTITVYDVRNRILGFISQNEGTVKGVFGKNSAEYYEFYPMGITEYRDSAMDIFSELIERYRLMAEKHAAKLPAGFPLQVVAFRDEYKMARDQQVTNKSDVSGDISETKYSREMACRELTRSLLTLAIDHLGDPDKADLYFDQSILAPKLSAGGNEIIEGLPGPGEKYVVMEEGFDPDTVFVIENKGTTILQFYTTQNPEGNVPGTTTEIAPGSKLEITASQLGADSNQFLICYNPSTDQTGSFIAEVKVKTK